MTDRRVAIVPARGGSKGIPRKNLRDVAGLPLVARTVQVARAAARVDAVYVSTDDSEIAELARRHGAGVIERPAELAGDVASSESALLHGLDWLKERSGEPEVLVMLQCTSPLTQAADIDAAVARVEDEGADSCFTAVPFFHFIWREQEGTARCINHGDGPRKRRQDLEPQFLEDGAVYVVRTSRFREEKTRFCGRTLICPASTGRALEIDEPVDLLQAEAVVRHLEAGERARLLPPEPSAIVFDFDGVFTDNAVVVDQEARESVRCDRGDGMGIELLRDRVPLLVLSRERNPVVSARTRKLNLEVLQGIQDKLPELERWFRERDLDPAAAIFVGNDVNDLECMRSVGVAVCPSDAHPEARAAARVVLERPGGHGAVRELCDLVLARLDEVS